jgi:hypothetical protein
MNRFKCWVCMDLGYILLSAKVNGFEYQNYYHCDMCDNKIETRGKNYRSQRISQFNTQKIAIANKKKYGVL